HRRARGGEVEGAEDDGARGREVARAVLVEFRELLPRPRVERRRRAGAFPQRPGGGPAGASLLPPREPKPYGMRERAVEAGRQRGVVARARALDVNALPQLPEPCVLLRAQRQRAV